MEQNFGSKRTVVGAHYGLRDWLSQRITAAVMALFTIVLLLQVLFGAEMGGSQTLIFGISHFLPGGGAGPDASPPEKIYYVLAGELTVIAGGKETVVKQGDSCYIGPNESREIVNRGNEVCTIAVAVAPVK